MKYLLKMMTVVAVLLAATTVKAAEITVTGEDRAALQAAFDAAENGDVILLTNSITLSGDGQFGLSKAITLKGEGENITIQAGEDSQRLFWFRPANPGELVLENLTFKGARNPDDGGVGRTGDGDEDGIVRFINCKFIDNKASRGGALDMYGGHIFFTDCEFIDNESTGRSGAVHTRGDNTMATFTNCKFVGNHANEAGVHFLESRSTAKFYNCIFSENYAGKVVNPEDWNENTGGGGGVFMTGGDGVLYVENSSIVKNYTLNNHGGVLFGNSSPTVSFVNTTIADNVMHRDANSMFFLTGGAIQFNLINSTVVNNNAYMADGAEPGHIGPNSGNSTGIAVRELNSRVKIHNSIIAGNLSRDGGLVPIDINLRDNMTPETVGTVLEIKNSVVGYINRLAKHVLAESVPGIETSVYNFYEANANWKDADRSGINWVRGLTTLDNGQAYYGLKGSSSAIDLGDPDLLAAYINPLVDQIGTPREGENITAGAIEFVQGESYCLDLGELTMGADKYDPETRTITYTGAWQFVGWEWNEGIDFSKYDYLEVVFNTGGITDATDVEFCVSYVGGVSGDGDYIVKPAVKDGMQTVKIPIGIGNRGKNADGGAIFVDEYPADATKLWRIGTKNSGKGIVVLESLCFRQNEPQACLDLDNLTMGADKYDPETRTITYTGSWQHVGWEWTEGADFSEYDELVVVFNTGGVTGAGDVEFCVSYVGGNGDGDYIAKPSVKDGMQTVRIPIGIGNRNSGQFVDEYPMDASKIWRIGTKNAGSGTVVFESLCFGYRIEEGCMDLNNLTFFQDKTSYDAKTHTITYDTNWQHAGWEWAEPQDFSEYQKVHFEFDGTGLPGADQDPGATKIQLIVMYDGGRFDGDEEVEVRNNVTSADVMLGVKGDAKKVKKIAVKSESPGTIVLNSVCLLKAEIDPVDLIITALRMEPENPKPGDEVVFFATVKNDSEFDSPADVKHGVAFSVNGSVPTGQWCDGFRGPLAAGEEIELSTTFEASSGQAWICGTSPVYTIKAQVNDTKDVLETNYDNNWSEEYTFTVDGKADLIVSRLTLAPGSPELGDEVTLTASVLNQDGEVDTPIGAIIIVNFYVNDVLVSTGEITSPVLAGNRTAVACVAKDLWIAAGCGDLVLKAVVNEDKAIEELDYDNNVATRELVICTSIDDVSIAGGAVYVKAGVLYVVNYPAAVVDVYNLLGRKVAGFNAVDGANVSLPAGAFIVKVQSEGKVFTHKIVVE